MTSIMGIQNWFGMNGHKNDKKTEEAVSRVVEARETVTSAANRLMSALDGINDSRMELTIGRLVKAKRAKQ